jgi:hypothetical protein
MNLIHGPKEPEMSKVRTKETDGKGLKSKGPLTEGPHEEREKVKSKGWLGVALAAGIAVFSFGTAVLTTNCTFSTKGIPAEQHDGGEEEDAAVDADTKDVKVPDAKVTDAKVLDAALDAGEDAAILDAPLDGGPDAAPQNDAGPDAEVIADAGQNDSSTTDGGAVDCPGIVAASAGFTTASYDTEFQTGGIGITPLSPYNVGTVTLRIVCANGGAALVPDQVFATADRNTNIPVDLGNSRVLTLNLSTWNATNVYFNSLGVTTN